MKLRYQKGQDLTPAIHLTPEDITVDNIQQPMYVGRTYNSLCPVITMLRYLEVRGIDDDPLLRKSDVTPLYRNMLVLQVKLALQQAGLDSSHCAGHSFWIGGATTAAVRGLSNSTIRMLGRWKSESFLRYIRTSRQDLAALSPLSNIIMHTFSTSNFNISISCTHILANNK